MPNPFDTSSPFNNNDVSSPIHETDSSSAEFFIHTMQDDLEQLQKPTSLPKKSEDSLEIQDKKSDFNLPINKVEKKSDNQQTPMVSPAPIKDTLASQVSGQTPLSEISKPVSEIKEIPVNQLQAEQGRGFMKFLITSIIVLIVAILGLGGYYYIQSNSKPKATSTPVQQQPQVSTSTPQEDNTPQSAVENSQAQSQTQNNVATEKYSALNPNYLALDLTTLTADAIRLQINNLATELAQYNQTTPYEFVVVDTNNNPVSFPIFSTAAKFNLSPDVLSNLDEKFSLYFYNDAGKMHLGIAANIKNKESLTAAISKQEKILPTDANFLFLGATPDIKTGTFNNGSYGTYSTRYLNLNSQGTLSIDYALANSQFVIGTSKNTLRAILDKLATTANGASQSSQQSDVSATSAATISSNNNSSMPRQTAGAANVAKNTANATTPQLQN